MFYYSDVVFERDRKAILSLIITKKNYNNAFYKIYDNSKRVIYQEEVKDNKIIFNITDLKEKLNNYTIEIIKENKIHTLPFLICLLEKDEKYIVCDIDFTLSATNLFLYISKNVLHIKALYNSQYFLNQLSKFFQIIYLTGRRQNFTKITKIWLEKNNFPPGPLLARSIDYNGNLKMFKTEVLKKITTISKNGIGIGDLKSDILAYLSNNIVPIKIEHPLFYYSKNNNYKYVRNYYVVFSWKGIEKLFIEKNLLGFSDLINSNCDIKF